MTGDRAESKSVNTSSQSGTWHPKVHCVTNLVLRTEEKGLSHPGAGPHPTAYLRFFLLKQQSRQQARRAGSDGSMSASGSAGPGFDPRRGSKF